MRRLFVLLIVVLLCSCNFEVENSVNNIDGTPKMDGSHLRIYNCTKNDVYFSLAEENGQFDEYKKLGEANLFEVKEGSKYILDVFTGKAAFVYDEETSTMNELSEHHSTAEITIVNGYTVVFIRPDHAIDVLSEGAPAMNGSTSGNHSHKTTVGV